MKKIILTVLISVGIYTTTFAQGFWTEETKKLEFGVEAGYNSSYLTADAVFPASYLSGFNAGVSAEYNFSERWGVKIKANYDQKGWGNGVISDEMGNETYGINFHLNYITIPVMADWHFGREKNWYLSFGPYTGILLSAKAANLNGLKDYLNTTDYGLSYGVGIKFPITEDTKLFIEFGGQEGLNTVFKESDGGIYQNVRGSINVGVNF